jgi:hypothetical protein
MRLVIRTEGFEKEQKKKCLEVLKNRGGDFGNVSFA